jgi:hypothetical protein
MEATHACQAGPVCPGRIRRLVREQLNSRLRDFEVVVTADGLVLTGRSRTYYAKQIAQHLVMNVSGLPILANRIEVVGAFDEEPEG